MTAGELRDKLARVPADAKVVLFVLSAEGHHIGPVERLEAKLVEHRFAHQSGVVVHYDDRFEMRGEE